MTGDWRTVGKCEKEKRPNYIFKRLRIYLCVIWKRGSLGQEEGLLLIGM